MKMKTKEKNHEYYPKLAMWTLNGEGHGGKEELKTIGVNN